MVSVYYKCVPNRKVKKEPTKRSSNFIYMYKKNALNLYYRKAYSIESSSAMDNTTWQSHLFRSYDALIGMKRMRWFPPKIPEHPDTARNKACQTKRVHYTGLPEAYMEPSEYILIPNREYKRTITWTDLTDVKQNEKSMQTVTNSANVKYRTDSNCEIQIDKPKIEFLPSSSSVSSPFQLDTVDDGPIETDRSFANKSAVASEGLSFRNESMKMAQLLGSLCSHIIICVMHVSVLQRISLNTMLYIYIQAIQ